eukprot:5071149-Prymnesium_polylepis.1
MPARERTDVARRDCLARHLEKRDAVVAAGLTHAEIVGEAKCRRGTRDIHLPAQLLCRTARCLLRTELRDPEGGLARGRE